MTDTPLTRRKALAGASVVGIGLLGAGFGRLVTPTTTRPDLRLDLHFDSDSTPDDDPNPNSSEATTVETPVPTPTGTTPASDGKRRRTGGGPFSFGGVPTPAVDTLGGTGGSSGDGGRSGGNESARITSSGESTAVSTPPLALEGVVPGDGGTVTATLTLADAPADLWLRTHVEEAENGRVEPEAGDETDTEGELADAVAVTLWLDVDGDGAPDGSVLYEGSLSGLSALAGGVEVAACLSPGTYPVRLRWSLPTTATNAVQTDDASFGIDFAATACSGTNPFA